MHFVDGFRDDIKSMVMIQRPSSFDAACALALVQEEAMDSRKKSGYICYDSSFNWSGHKSAYPLPPPPKLDKPANSFLTDDKRSTEASCTTSNDNKLRALKQYRRAKGLCDKCVEKWSYSHKCSSTM
jgi:hypothetical protein